MTHLKKDFTYHQKFMNKYTAFSYFFYLYRGKKVHISRRSGDDDVPRSIKNLMATLIYCNNKICQRGSMDLHKEQIKESIKEISNDRVSLYTRDGYDNCWHRIGDKWDDDNYYYRDNKISSKCVGTYSELAELLRNSRLTNECYLYVANLIDKVVYWGENIDNDFDGFMDFIYDFIQDYREKHYGWSVGDNILYDRSAKDNILKRVYCVANNEIGIEKFINAYSKMVSICEDDKDNLIEQVIAFLITLSDVNNLLAIKENEKAIILLNDYYEDNFDMDTCIDIYYKKSFEKLINMKNEYDNTKDLDTLFKSIKALIEYENKRFSEYITIYEKVPVDFNIEEYKNVVPLV